MARKARHAIAQHFVLSLDQRQLHFHIMITKGGVALPPANSSTDNWLEHRVPFIPLDTGCKFHPDTVITLYLWRMVSMLDSHQSLSPRGLCRPSKRKAVMLNTEKWTQTPS